MKLRILFLCGLAMLMAGTVSAGKPKRPKTCNVMEDVNYKIKDGNYEIGAYSVSAGDLIVGRSSAGFYSTNSGYAITLKNATATFMDGTTLQGDYSVLFMKKGSYLAEIFFISDATLTGIINGEQSSIKLNNDAEIYRNISTKNEDFQNWEFRGGYTETIPSYPDAELSKKLNAIEAFHSKTGKSFTLCRAISHTVKLHCKGHELQIDTLEEVFLLPDSIIAHYNDTQHPEYGKVYYSKNNDLFTDKSIVLNSDSVTYTYIDEQNLGQGLNSQYFIHAKGVYKDGRTYEGTLTNGLSHRLPDDLKWEFFTRRNDLRYYTGVETKADGTTAQYTKGMNEEQLKADMARKEELAKQEQAKQQAEEAARKAQEEKYMADFNKYISPYKAKYSAVYTKLTKTRKPYVGLTLNALQAFVALPLSPKDAHLKAVHDWYNNSGSIDQKVSGCYIAYMYYYDDMHVLRADSYRVWTSGQKIIRVDEIETNMALRSEGIKFDN